jgi:GTPase
MTMDDLSSFLLSDIKEVKSDYEIEYDYGNKEYKLKLCDVNDERIEGLVTQMKFRLEEGGGECFYEIGVEDNGNPLGLPKDELELSVETLKKIVEKLDATATVTNLHKGKVGLIAEVMIKQKEKLVKNDKLEIKIGLLGEESSGKSTLIGVLISNKLDNGKGLARFNVFRHKHEILCGKTSSISHQILGFDENGELTNYGKIEKPSWAQIVNKSAKILNFYDMGGTNKNFNKTVSIY